MNRIHPGYELESNSALVASPKTIHTFPIKKFHNVACDISCEKMCHTPLRLFGHIVCMARLFSETLEKMCLPCSPTHYPKLTGEYNITWVYSFQGYAVQNIVLFSCAFTKYDCANLRVSRNRKRIKCTRFWPLFPGLQNTLQWLKTPF